MLHPILVVIILVLLFCSIHFIAYIFGGQEFSAETVNNSSLLITWISNILTSTIFILLYVMINCFSTIKIDSVPIQSLLYAIWKSIWAAFPLGGLIFVIVSKFSDIISREFSTKDGLPSFRFAFSLSFVFHIVFFIWIL